MVIQSDGRILVAGSSSNDADGGDNDFAVARYTKGGLLDPTFGQGGKTLVDFEDGDDIANCIALQNDGKVIIAGSSEKSGKRVLALARFNPDGRRDLTFGKRGKVVTEFEGRNGIATGVSLLSDGRIIIVGSVYSGGRRDVFLVRYHPNGGIDEKFGEGGKVITKIGNSADANGVVIQHDGKMIVAGAATDGHRYGFCVLRYLESGKLDVRLETPGNVRAASEKGDDFGYAVALDRNGDILVAGVSMDVKGAKALLVRYKGN